MYGVHSERQRYSPAAGGLTIAVFEKLAERSFAPKVARPGVPTGTSGGGRHTTSFHDANAFSAVVASTRNIGMSSVCPAAVRCRYHVWPGVTAPRHAVCCAANCVADEATSRSPSSGSVAPPRSTACALRLDRSELRAARGRSDLVAARDVDDDPRSRVVARGDLGEDVDGAARVRCRRPGPTSFGLNAASADPVTASASARRSGRHRDTCCFSSWLPFLHCQPALR